MTSTSNSNFEPVIWREKERLNGKIVDCLTVILKTAGCRWNRCRMCGFASSAYPATEEELIWQIERVFERIDGEEVLKIFTSGSFFDDTELTPYVREKILERFVQAGMKKLIVESRPEYITESKLTSFKGINLEVGIGLESANDRVREFCVNKGFKFADFARAAETIREMGFRVKTYLLLKPPFLSESEAIEDAVDSIAKAKSLTDVFSLNLTNVQKGTFVEKLWKAKLYRPPWLWSAVEVLKKAKVLGVEILSDPVAAGKLRGPHNCGKCDESFERAIRDFSLTQDVSRLESLQCSCIKKWEMALKLERYSRTPLF